MFEAGESTAYQSAGNNPLLMLDPLGLLTEVLTFDPVGYGKSSFGHTAININGTTYSFGESGWHIENTADFLKRNNFRNAVGQELNLTPAEEGLLVQIIREDNRQNPQWTVEVSCVRKIRDVLEIATHRPYAIYPSASVISPLDFRDNLVRFGYVSKTNNYPKAR